VIGETGTFLFDNRINFAKTRDPQKTVKVDDRLVCPRCRRPFAVPSPPYAPRLRFGAFLISVPIAMTILAFEAFDHATASQPLYRAMAEVPFTESGPQWLDFLVSSIMLGILLTLVAAIVGPMRKCKDCGKRIAGRSKHV
jgi:hypothetical protein